MKEALKLALEALHGFIPYLPLNDETQCGRYDKALTAIKEALANDTSQERVDETSKNVHKPCGLECDCTDVCKQLAQRTWVGLTDEEMQDLWDRYAHMEMMRAIEAKLKEKNT